MANFQDYRTEDGKKRVVAVIRIKGFKRTSKAFDSLRDAKEWAEATERELRGLRDRGGARADITRLTLAKLVTAFLADPKVQQRRYYPELETLLASWVNEYGTERTRGFGYLQITAMRDTLLASGLSPGRVNRYLSAMRRAWNWGQPHYTQAPWPQKVMLEEPKPEAILERYGTADATLPDIAALIAECDKEEPALGNLVRFLIGTGARLSDALAVRARDVDAATETVAIKGQKAQRPQRVAMLAPAVDAIARTSKVRHVRGLLFWQLEPERYAKSDGKEHVTTVADATRRRAQYLFQNARARFPAHLRQMRLHDCRHLCASLLAAQGASHVELAAQLGHSTLVMVKRYSHLAAGHRGEAHRKVDEAFGKPTTGDGNAKA
jgi:integrase